jgi:hypothetical protein
MASCGVWMTPRRLVACMVDDDGAVCAPPLSATPSDDGCWNLIAHVEAYLGLDCGFVVCQRVADHTRLVRLATRRGSHLRVAPDPLLVAARRLTGFARPSPKRLALLLARMPLCAPFAQRLTPVDMQLPLL